MQGVYAVTTIGKVQKEASRIRTVGIWADKAQALDILKKNFGDLNEAGYYPWAVIELCPFGLYPVFDEEKHPQTWFEFKDGAWVKLDKIPDYLSSWLTANYSLNKWYEIG